VSLALPVMNTSKDLVAAASALAQAVTSGEVTPAEGADLSHLVANVAKAIEVSELEERLQRLEETVAAKGGAA
jgi:hypothetical protein